MPFSGVAVIANQGSLYIETISLLSAGEFLSREKEVREIEELRFSQDHLWVRVDEDGRATIGITDYLQEELGEIINIRLPDEGEELVKDEAFSIVETPDGLVELLAPISGDIIEVNYELLDVPELATEEPYIDGWLVRVDMLSESGFDDLLSLEEYEDYIQERELQEN